MARYGFLLTFSNRWKKLKDSKIVLLFTGRISDAAGLGNDRDMDALKWWDAAWSKLH